jgi:hypothetical protein
MAFGDPYMSVEEFLATAGSVDVTDARVLRALNSASRQIDRMCSQRFDQTDANTVRYFSAIDGYCLTAYPIVSVATIATDVNGERTYTDTWA